MLPNFAILDRESLTVQINDTLPADLTLRVGEISRFFSTATRISDRQAAEDMRLRGDASDADLLLVASSLWHEKRHFLDLVLTNYGASLFRQTVEVQFNLYGTLVEQRSMSPDLLIPLDLYLDGVRQEIVTGESTAVLTPSLRGLLTQIKTKRRRFARDRLSLSAGQELNGTAILETLAYLTQLSSIMSFFGEEAATAVQKRASALSEHNILYTWALHLSILLTQQRKHTHVREIIADPRPYGPLLFACLVGRTWLSDDMPPANYESLPVGRLLAISRYLRDAGRSLHDLTAEEAYEVIDQALADMWSERIISALAEGLEWEAGQLERWEAAVNPAREVPFRVWTDYFKTRVDAIQQFEANPLAFADIARFGESALPRLRPITLFVRPQGATDSQPSDGALVYYDKRSLGKDDRGGESAEVDIWWAYRIKDKPRNVQHAIQFADPEAWMDYMKLYVAASRLLLDGRRVRTVCGPEIALAEVLLKNVLDFRLRFDPQHEYPPVEINPTLFRLFFGSRGKRCDLTERPLEPESAAFVSPLLIQMSAHNRNYVLEHGPPSFALGGQSKWFGFSPDWDWSVWVVHRDVLPDLQHCHVQRR